MSITIYENWFDNLDKEQPYKAIGMIKTENGNAMQCFRFDTLDKAIGFFNECEHRCIVSHHDFNKRLTKIIAYKFN